MAFGPRSLVQREERRSSCAESWASDSRATVRAKLPNWRSMASKSEKSAREWVSSELMESSRTERNSVNVRWRVWRVRWWEDSPKIDVARVPTRVGVPDGVSRTPHLVNNVWTLSKADVIGDGGRS